MVGRNAQSNNRLAQQSLCGSSVKARGWRWPGANVPGAMEDGERTAGSSDFGTLLRRHRLTAGFSQEALAERAGMSTNGISALERGYRRTPHRETLALLAASLSLKPDERARFEAAAARPSHPRYAPVFRGGVASEGAAFALPISLATFVGRRKELEEISALVREHRFVTLTGTGGIGKTQTALQVATGLEHDDRALCFVGLAPIADSTLVAPTIAAALGVQEAPDRPLLDSLVAYLQNQPLLLILDNCEHVIEKAASVVERLLGGCPSLRIIATSREPLRVAGERAYRLPSLEVPEPDEARRLGAGEVAAYGAIVLFADRARAVDHRFVLTDENVPIVSEICRRLDGIPLAIELTAARVNLLSLKALARKLDDRLKLLTGGERMALPRQQTMRATIDWSYNLLTLPEQRLFERLSIFAGGATITTAAGVCGDDDVTKADVFIGLSSLVDKSLVAAELEGNQPRYALCESFREYAREKLERRGEAQIVAHRQARLALELAERLENVYDSEPDDVWRALAREELDNWRTALQWALAGRGEIRLGQRLAGALRVVWQYFAPLEGRHWLALARELIDEETTADVLAALSYAEAIAAWTVRDHHVHLAASERAAVQYRANGDALGAVRAQGLVGHALMALGRSAEARPHLHQALSIARARHSRRLVAYIVRCLGWDSCVNTGDVVAARAYYAEALQIYDSLGAKLNYAFALNDLSECESVAGNVELALQFATEAVEPLRAFNETPLVAQALDNIALYLVLLDRYDEAETRAREALALALDYRRESRHLEFLAAQALQHLAATKALRVGPAQERRRFCSQSARILGFVDARLAALGSGRLNNQEQREYDRVLAALGEAIGADSVAGLMADGAAMSEEEAVAEATGAPRSVEETVEAKGEI
jgi:predicted ATPase/ribosome-binding protein aMBF1 (putative translation factor)